jgi:hypothetical protein
VQRKNEIIVLTLTIIEAWLSRCKEKRVFKVSKTENFMLGVVGNCSLLVLDEELDLGEGWAVVTLGRGHDQHQVSEENLQFATVA